MRRADRARPRSASARPAPTRRRRGHPRRGRRRSSARAARRRAGGPHAEVVALRAAGDRARGGTAVVTLEPCNHTGRTGRAPTRCSRPASPAWWSRVRDPNPVAAGGAETLRAAGRRGRGRAYAAAEAAPRAAVLADRGTPAPPVRDLEVRRDAGRPQSAAADGTSQWITSERGARRRAPAARAPWTRSSSASARCSPTTPQLTVRGDAGALADRQPLRVVVDSAGRTPANARSATTPHPPGSPPPRTSAPAPTAGSTCDALLDARCTRAACAARCWRAGRRWPARSWRAGLVDEVVGYVAPKLLGAGAARSADAGVDHHRRRHRPGTHRRHPDRAGPARRPRVAEREPDDVHRHRRGLGEVAALTDLGDAARHRGARHAGHRRTPATATRSRSTASA